MSARWIRFGLGALVLCAAFAEPAWARQKTLKANVYNYKNAPVELKGGRAALVETYLNPTQTWTPDAKGSRVRYANRKDIAPSAHVLDAEVTIRNASRKPVEAVAITVVLLDAFHQPVFPANQPQMYPVEQVMATLMSGGNVTHKWEQHIGVDEVYEIALVVTRVRFTDGTIWQAPQEELIGIF